MPKKQPEPKTEARKLGSGGALENQMGAEIIVAVTAIKDKYLSKRMKNQADREERELAVFKTTINALEQALSHFDDMEEKLKKELDRSYL